jgi:hypothetical protein
VARRARPRSAGFGPRGLEAAGSHRGALRGGGTLPASGSGGGALPATGARSTGRDASAGGSPGFGSDSAALTAAVQYARSHGGGTVAVESQGSAAAAILAGQSDLAGLGGFSGVESSVSVRWLATEVRDGHLRWLLADTSSRGGLGGFGGGTPLGSAGTGSRAGGFGSGSHIPFGPGGGSGSGSHIPFGPGGGSTRGGPRGFSVGRTGSQRAFTAAEKVARKVTITVDGTTVTLYDLQGKAAAILADAERSRSATRAA